MSTDLTHALRLSTRRPFYTAALVLTLALGIGANTAIFSVVRAVLLRPLPYHEPNRLIFVWLERGESSIAHGRGHSILTGTDVREWERRATTLQSVAAISSWSHNPSATLDIATDDGAERVRGAFVTPNFFELLGVRPALGRAFDTADRTSATPLIVISEAFWRRRFGADPSVVGRTVDLIRGRDGRQRYTIVGVLPPGFRFTYPLETEVWGMLPWTRIVPSRAVEFQLVARLKPAITVAQAQGELTSIARDASRTHRLPQSTIREEQAFVESVAEHIAAEARPGMLLLVAGAGLVLLIGCVNVALLLLALVVDRHRELAVRVAIGARRSQIIRQLLVESGMLAAFGAALGIAVAWLMLPAIRALVPLTLPRGDEVSLDPVVLAFASGITVMTALLCGMAPAWHAANQNVQNGLRFSSVSATGDRRITLSRRAIVVVQVAVVLVLLVGASLLFHSFLRLQNVDLGFAGDGVITMEMRLLNPKYRQPGRVAEFQRRVMERVRALPGVEQASMTSSVPLRGVDFLAMMRPLGGSARKPANMRPVDPEYFSLMRIPVLAGRTFTPADDERAAEVAVVSRAYGRSLFGDQNPVGRHLETGLGSAEIVGVVADVRHKNVTKTAMPALYFPRAQRPTELICLVVRPVAGAKDTGAAIRRAIQAIDPEQPVQNITTLDRIIRDNTSETRFYTVTTAGFALVAVLLAVAGLAGVVSRTVTERTREIAIRMALGAEPRQLRRLAIRSAMFSVVLGVATGMLGAWSASRVLRRFLFEISPLDPAAYLAAVAVLGGAAVLACYVPARRATRIEPIAALKTE